MGYKQIFAGVIAALLAAPVLADANKNDIFEVVEQGVFHDALYDACFDGDKGLAVGYIGTLLESNDAGKSWVQALGIKTESTLLGASCNGAKRIVVGQQGSIFVEGDDKSWASIEPITGERLLAVDMNTNGLAVAVGGFGTILRSKDSGQSWEALPQDWEALIDDFMEPHLFDVNVDEAGVITLVGEFEVILRSTDSGDTWAKVHEKSDPSLFGLDINEKGVGFAVGQEGKVLKTVDGGANWQLISTDTKSNLLSVWHSDQGEVIIIGIRDLIRSSDSASTWRPSGAGIGDVPIALYQALAGSGEKVYMVGHSGRIVQLTK